MSASALLSVTQPAPAIAPARRPSFREQQFAAREQAILTAVNRLLATKGYDLMTMDEVAGEVGIAKPSLYKHFVSKEQLAAVAMEKLLDRMLDVISAQPLTQAPIDSLKQVLRWALKAHLDGSMPLLPSTRSSLRAALVNHAPYFERLVKMTEAMGTWIEAAKADRSVATTLPSEVVMYTLFARACDPTLEFLRETGQYTDEQIVELMVTTCFGGLASR
ncbi:TetR family transcriptional regulator [beta proteobacterium AAP99]|jgi:AcrR family transcriptional regulator|nr:TetR family transcriptional regulator [beta proteobacterium AAP99]